MSSPEPADREGVITDLHAAATKLRTLDLTALPPEVGLAFADLLDAAAQAWRRMPDPIGDSPAHRAARVINGLPPAQVRPGPGVAEALELARLTNEGPVTERDEALATLQRVKHAHGALMALRDKSAADADAGYRGSECYSDAYENADRLIRTALKEQT